MATLVLAEYGFDRSFGFGFNNLAMPGWTLAPIGTAPASTLTLDREGFRMVLSGAFQPGTGGAVSGNLTGITVYEGARPVYQLSGLAPQDVAPLLDYVLNDHGTLDLRETIFAGNDTVTGSAGGDTIYTGAGKDRIEAGAGNDVIDAGAGNDTIDGGDGIDSANPGGPFTDFRIERDGTTFTLTSLKDGSVDVYRNVELINFGRQFIDTRVDVDNTGGQVFRMYQAALGRAPDQLGLPFWTSHLGKDLTLEQMAQAFTDSYEYKQLYGGGLSNHDLVARYYENVLHRAPDEAGLAFWTAHLDAGDVSNAQVLAAISESPENIGNSAAVLAHGALIDTIWVL